MKPFVVLLLVLSALTASAQTGWFRLFPDVQGKFKDIAFPTAEKGFLVTGEPSHLYMTTDGGGSWNEVSVPPCTNCIYNFGKLYFANPLVGHITGWTYDGNIAAKLHLQSTDGGITWNAADTSDKYPYPFSAPSPSVAFQPRENRFFKTIDSGHTWTIIDTLFSDDDKYQAFDFQDDQDILTISTYSEPLNYNVQHTTDGGSTWEYRNVTRLAPYEVSLTSVKAIEHNIYLIGSVYSGIYRTSDNTLTWEKVSNYPSNDFGFFDTKIGYSGGFYTRIIQKTTDGGTTWTKQNVAELAIPWRRIVSPTALTAYALGNDSLLYKTIDGGVGSQSTVSENKNSEELSVTPQMSNTSITITVPANDRNVEILDITGIQVWRKQNMQGSHITVDVTELPVGLYFVRTTISCIRFLRVPN